MASSATVAKTGTATAVEADPTITQPTQKRKQTISDFVDSSFASVDRNYPKTSQGSSLVKILANEAAEERSKSRKEKKGHSNARNSEFKDDEKDEEDEAYATFTYLAILTALYLPFLLFLWIRRNVFGTASLVRSLFFGHMLRFGVAFLLLPPSTTKTFVPTPLWNFGLKALAHADKFWNDKRTQAMIPDWAHVVLSMILGFQTDNRAIGGGALEKAKKSWPPPGVICFIVFTILSFVVHPDGVTWIMLGQIQEFVHTSALEAAEYVEGLRNGTIKMKPSEISGTIATIIIVVTIFNSVLSNREQNVSVRHREKVSKHKHKRGKKGRGRNHHGGSSSGGRGRIRGGHYRSTKDIFVGERGVSPDPTTISLSPTRRMRTLSDEDSTVTSSTASGSNQPILDAPSRRESPSERSQDSVAKLEESSVPKLSPVQVVDDEKSCASSVATAQTNTTENGTKKKARKVKGKRGGQKPPASAPSTPRATEKVKNRTFLSKQSTPPNVSHQSRETLPDPERKYARKLKKSHKEKSVNGNNGSYLTERKPMPRPRDPPNRRRSFTAPEVGISHAHVLKDALRVDSNSEENSGIPISPSPALNTQDALVPLKPLCSMSIPMNERRMDVCGNNINVGIERPNRLDGKHEKFSMLGITRTHLNSNDSLFSNSPAENELSLFLIRLGLVGTTYAELMANLASVDSFALFTDTDYIKYGIEPAQRAEIISHLEQRKLLKALGNRQNLTIGWKSNVVRPPPGLEAPPVASEHSVGAPPRIVSPIVGASSKSKHSLTYFSSSSTSVPSTYSLAPGSSLNSFSVPLGAPQCNSDQFLAGSPLGVSGSSEDDLRRRVNNRITLQSISPLQQNVHLPIQSSAFTFTTQEHNEEEIEADLQELGGQMAGSILDF